VDPLRRDALYPKVAVHNTVYPVTKGTSTFYRRAESLRLGEEAAAALPSRNGNGGRK